MKNLKRLLSLALTGVMLVGMMAIGASAVEYKDFTDVGEIENTEAVSTMVVLGVINGKDNGSFDPEGTVTRAEMAKMITVTLFGGSDPKLGTTTSGGFDDVKGHWAQSYIEYCASQGIIAGMGNNKFDPAGNVTGQQAAKMLLVAIGRNADAFGYVGGDWALNTMGDAISMGLFENLTDIDPSQPLTREDAAQMIYNALDVVLWERQPNLNLSTGVVTNGYGENLKGETLLTAKFKVNTSYGILTTVDEDELKITGEVNGYKNGEKAKTDFSGLKADYSDLLGQAVKVLYKEIKGEDVVFGVAPLAMNKTVTANVNAVENKDGKIKVGGKTYSLDTGAEKEAGKNKINVIVDGAAAEVKDATYFDGKDLSTDKVILVDNDNDGKFNYAIVTTATYEKVIYTSSTSIITTSTYTYEDDTIPTGLKKGDWVAVSKDLFTGGHTLEKIEAIEAKINGTKGTSPKQFLMDGTWYKAVSTLSNEIDVGKTAKAFILNGVIVAGEKIEGETGSIDDIAIVLAAEKTDGTNTSLFTIRARLMFADGTVDTVTINKDSKFEGGEFVTYTVKNGVYTLKKMAGPTTDDEGKAVAATAPEATGWTWVDGVDADVVADAKNDKVEKLGKTNAYTVADDAVIYLVTKGNDDDTGFKNAAIITGAELKTIAADKFETQALGFYYAKSNGLNKVVLAALTVSGKTLPGIGSNDTKYGYIVVDAYKSGSKEVTYTIWNGSKNEPVVEKMESVDTTIRKAGTFITYGDVNADGEILGVKTDVITLTPGAVQGITGTNKITLNGKDEIEIDKDCAYLYIDSSVSNKTELGKVAGELAPATEVVEGVFVQNILYHITDSKIDVIVIDVKNKLTAAFGATELTADTNTAGLTFKTTDGKDLPEKVLAGDAITLEYNVKSDIVNNSTDKITLTNAKFADGKTEMSLAGVKKGLNKVTIYVEKTGFKAETTSTSIGADTAEENPGTPVVTPPSGEGENT